jgi:hypothetical protein
VVEVKVMIGSVWVTVPSAYWYVVKVGAVTVLLAWVIKIVVDVNVVVTVSAVTVVVVSVE